MFPHRLAGDIEAPIRNGLSGPVAILENSNKTRQPTHSEGEATVNWMTGQTGLAGNTDMTR